MWRNLAPNEVRPRDLWRGSTSPIWFSICKKYIYCWGWETGVQLVTTVVRNYCLHRNSKINVFWYVNIIWKMNSLVIWVCFGEICVRFCYKMSSYCLWRWCKSPIVIETICKWLYRPLCLKVLDICFCSLITVFLYMSLHKKPDASRLFSNVKPELRC